MKTIRLKFFFALFFIILTILSCTNPSSPSVTTPVPSPLSVSDGSGTVLNVNLLWQQKNRWCWAASMQMIMKYHVATSKDQSKLLEDFCFFKGLSSTNCYKDTCNVLGSNFNTCTYPIYVYKPGSPPYANNTQYFNSVFLRNGWASLEDINISWEKLKFEINHCRPVIIIRDTSNLGEVIHAVVAKGFIEFNDGTRKVIVNDPFGVCTGHLDYLKFPIEKLKEVIYYISPNVPEPPCTLCNDKNKTQQVSDSLITSLKQGTLKFATTQNLSIQRYIDSTNRDSQYNIIPVRRLDLNKINSYYKYPTIDSSAFNGTIRFNNIYDTLQSVDITPKSIANPLLYRMTKNVNGYSDEKISPYIPYDFNKIKSIATSVKAFNYYLVESYFLDYDFFVFETPTGNFISKVTREKQYTLSNPIDESSFWKINEKSIFQPIF